MKPWIIYWAIVFVVSMVSHDIAGFVFGKNDVFVLLQLVFMVAALAGVIVGAIASIIRKRNAPALWCLGNLVLTPVLLFGGIALAPDEIVVDALRGRPEVVAFHEGTQGMARLTFRKGGRCDIAWSGWPGTLTVDRGTYTRSGGNFVCRFSGGSQGPWTADAIRTESGKTMLVERTDREGLSLVFTVSRSTPGDLETPSPSGGGQSSERDDGMDSADSKSGVRPDDGGDGHHVLIEWAHGTPRSGALVRLHSPTDSRPRIIGFYLVLGRHLYPLPTRSIRMSRPRGTFSFTLKDDAGSATGDRDRAVITCGRKEWTLDAMDPEALEELAEGIRTGRSIIHASPPTVYERAFRGPGREYFYISRVRYAGDDTLRFYQGERGAMKSHPVASFTTLLDGGTTIVGIEDAGQLLVPQTMFEEEDGPTAPTWTPNGGAGEIELAEVPVTERLRRRLDIPAPVLPVNREHPDFCATFFP